MTRSFVFRVKPDAVRAQTARSWVYKRGVIAIVLALVAPVSAIAQSEAPSAPPSANAQFRGENGKPGGKPFDITLNYASDLNADVDGGQSRGLDYLGRISVLVDADLDRLLGLRNATAHVSVYQIHGTGLSSRHVGNLLIVSGLEAEPALRLNQLWVEIEPTAAAKLRVGKFTAAQEFMVSQTANLFVNSTFGWPDSFATDLPSGGPSYPLAAPGARLALRVDTQTTLRIAAFTGDPAGPGSGDPQQREKHGFNTFKLSGRPFVIAEINRAVGGSSPTLTTTLGGWVHFDRFADLSNPMSVPGPVVGPGGHQADLAVYGLVDARLWQSASSSNRALNGFVRATISPPDRNPVDVYLDAGISLSSPFPGRDGDTVGFGFGLARISPRLRSAARAELGSGGMATVPPPFESALELTYQATLVGPLKVQPNIQYVIHPASSALAIRSPGGRIPNALVFGVRTSASF